MLENYLKVKTAEKAVFSLAELKRKFPKEKERIETLKFIGIIEPVNIEFPDSVKASMY